MPITQARMLALINAAEDFRQARETLQHVIHDALQEIRQAEPSIRGELALRSLQSIHDGFTIFQPDVQSAVTLATEKQHFQIFSRRNDRVRVNQAARRRELGITLQNDRKRTAEQRGIARAQTSQDTRRVMDHMDRQRAEATTLQVTANVKLPPDMTTTRQEIPLPSNVKITRDPNAFDPSKLDPGGLWLDAFDASGNLQPTPEHDAGAMRKPGGMAQTPSPITEK